MTGHILVWAIAIATVAGILTRPRGLPEAVFACAGALLLVLAGRIAPQDAGRAIAKGADVYLFLTGMMLLSELARREGVFDWVATHAVRAARGSAARLFALVYLVGTCVTVFLSNDATAVVLTPAVYAAVRKARVHALPYLLCCAFIANAASFALPISNPANLVVYGRQLPPLLPWLRAFLLPSVLSIVATYAALRLYAGKTVTSESAVDGEPAVLTPEGILASAAIALAAAVMLTASALGKDLGLPTCIAAVTAILVATRCRPSALTPVVRGVSWSVIPLVAGLFVIVAALDGAGALRDVLACLSRCAAMPPLAGNLVAAFGVAGLCNVTNNLPAGLLVGGALQQTHDLNSIRSAVLIGVDLGPNLSVTGSLATILWLVALRREGEHVSAGQFLRTGACVMTPALLLATIALTLAR